MTLSHLQRHRAMYVNYTVHSIILELFGIGFDVEHGGGLL